MSARITVRSVSTLFLCVSLLALCSARAFADWDSLTAFVRVAKEAEIAVETPREFDLSKLSPMDAVVIVGPRQALPVSGLTTFLREGGRVALFDDVGSGERLLGAYQVSRKPAQAAGIPMFRADPNLLIAYPESEHPLVDGVPLLLTNRATELYHPDLRPVFSFGQSGHALVLAGAVGAGRLVAVGDASVVIDQLMEIPSHARFAKNVLTYLARPSGRLWLIDANTTIRGSYGQKKAGLSRLDNLLKQASRPDLPESALLVLALSALGIAAILGAGVLPRRSPYVRPDLFPSAKVYAGYAGRIAVAEQPGVNLVWSVLDYKRELEAELHLRLSLPNVQNRRELTQRACGFGLSANEAGELVALLDELDAVAAKLEQDSTPPQVRVSYLGNVVRKGEALLARVGERRE